MGTFSLQLVASATRDLVAPAKWDLCRLSWWPPLGKTFVASVGRFRYGILIALVATVGYLHYEILITSVTWGLFRLRLVVSAMGS